jgi:hypothetical protein
MYSLHPQVLERFVTSIQKIVQEKDLNAWRKAYASFEATSRNPGFSPYSSTLDTPVPLTKIHYQSNLPDLSADEVPEWSSRSLRWLLRTHMLSMSEFHLSGGWEKFGSWFITNLWEELERKGGAEFEEHQQVVKLFFDSKQAFPPLLEVLQLNDSAYESFVSAEHLASLIEMEDRVGLLRSLSREYCGSSDGITRGLGDEMGMIEHFLRLLQFRNRNSAVYYFQWST